MNWGALETQTYEIQQGGMEYLLMATNQFGNSNQLNNKLNTINFRRTGSNFIVRQFESGKSGPYRGYIVTGSIKNGATQNNTLCLGGQGAVPFTYKSLSYTSPPLSYIRRQNSLTSQSGVFDSEFYYKQDLNTAGSQRGYTDDNEIFDVKRSDEIRLVDSSNKFIIFTVISASLIDNTISQVLTTEMNVFPNPQDYNINSTSSFTIRRRRDVDNKVILKVPFLSGSLGTVTPSSDGYLVPSDFTIDQKDKVGKLIAVLKGNNVFD